MEARPAPRSVPGGSTAVQGAVALKGGLLAGRAGLCGAWLPAGLSTTALRAPAQQNILYPSPPIPLLLLGAAVLCRLRNFETSATQEK